MMTVAAKSLLAGADCGGPRGPRCRRVARSAVVGLALVVAATAPLVAVPSDRDEWIRLESAEFVIYSEVGERKTRQIALSFERLRDTLGVLEPGLDRSSPAPTTILLFDGERSYRPYKEAFAGRADRVLGHFQSHPLANYIAINAYPSGRRDALPVVYHEYVHYFLSVQFPEIPLWFNEGLAEYYATFRHDDEQVEIGWPNPYHVVSLRQHSFIPLERLFAVTRDSPEYREGERTGMFYAQCWLLVHYLLSGGGEVAESAGTFLVELGEGRPVEEAFASAFDSDFETLERELRGYVNSRDFAYVRAPVPKARSAVRMEARPVPTTEIAYQLGTFLALGGPENAVAAEEHLAIAAPEDADALASLAISRELEGDFAAAFELHRRAQAAGVDEALSYTGYGSLLLRGLRGEALLPLPPRELALDLARESLERAVAIDPELAEARALLGVTYLLGAEEEAGEGVRHLQRARRQLPTRVDVAHNLAMLSLRAGDVAAAERLVREVVVPSGRDDLAAEAMAALRRAELIEEANAALADGDFGTALDALREALSVTSAPAIRAGLEATIARVEREAVTQVEVDRYNAAVRAANWGELEEARGLLVELLEEAVDQEVRRLAEELLAKVAAALY